MLDFSCTESSSMEHACVICTFISPYSFTWANRNVQDHRRIAAASHVLNHRDMLGTRETHDFLWQWLPLSESWSCRWWRCRNRIFLIQPGNSVPVGFLEHFQFGAINVCRLWACQRQSTSVPEKNIWYILWSCWTVGLWDCLLKRKKKLTTFQECL